MAPNNLLKTVLRSFMPVKPSRLYVFGVFSLDADERELLRAGAAVPIAPKAMDVLLILIENAGRSSGRS